MITHFNIKKIMTKIAFDKYAGTYDGHEIVYYYINPKLTSIEEFMEIQYVALCKSALKKQRIFRKYVCANVNADAAIVCLN